MNAKKISLVIFGVALIIFVSIAFHKNNSLDRNFAITNAYIYDFGNSRNAGSTIFFKFKFSVNSITYNGNSGMPCERAKTLFFQSWANGKEVQVVYDKKNPDNCSILLTKENYMKYGLDIPNEYKSQTEFIDSLCN